MLGMVSPSDMLKGTNGDFVSTIMQDIGDLDFNIFYFYVEWLNEIMPLAMTVAHQIKKINKQVKILMGGAYGERYGKEIIEKFKFIDYIAASQDLLPIFETLLKGPPQSSEIPNIFYFDTAKDQPVETKRQAVIWDELPYPDFDLFYGKKESDSKILPFRLSRGCKYTCFFCILGGKLSYYKNIDGVVSHIEECKKKHHVENFYFEDAALNFNNKYLEEFIDKLIERNLNIRWSSYFIAQNLSLTMIKKIRLSGCTHIRWGIETVEPSFAKKIAKNLKIVEVEEILKRSSEMGIANQVSFIVGFPHETAEAIEKMKRFILKSKKFLGVVNIYIFKPRRGTLTHDSPERYGIRILDNQPLFEKDLVPFDEINGQRWIEKRSMQKIFYKNVSAVIRESDLIDVDPQEFFKSQVLNEYGAFSSKQRRAFACH